MMQNRFQWWKLAVPSLILSSVLVTLWINQGKNTQPFTQNPEGVPTLPLANQTADQPTNPYLHQPPSESVKNTYSVSQLPDPNLNEIPTNSPAPVLPSSNPGTTSPSTPIQFGVDPKTQPEKAANWGNTPTIPSFDDFATEPSAPKLPTSQLNQNQQELQKKSLIYKRKEDHRLNQISGQTPMPAPRMEPTSEIIRTLVTLQEEFQAIPGKQISFSLVQPITIKKVTIPAGSKIIGVIGANLNTRTQISVTSLITLSGTIPISGEILDPTTNIPGLATDTPNTKKNWRRTTEAIQQIGLPILTGQPAQIPPHPQPEPQQIPVIRIQNGIAQLRF